MPTVADTVAPWASRPVAVRTRKRIQLPRFGTRFIEQVGGGIAVDDDEIEAAVVVDVANGHAAAGVKGCLGGSADRLDFDEATVRCSPIERVRFGELVALVLVSLGATPPFGFV